MDRSIRRLYLTLAAGFGVLVLLLGYWQVVAAPSLGERNGNAQAIQRERLVDRGRILSSDGRVLAASRARRVEGQRVFERLYPQGGLAAHAVGYTSTEQGSKTALEDSYDRFLSGSFGSQPLLQRLNLAEKEGANVLTHLDTRVQQVAVDALSGARGAVVALDPATGAVLAMASAPSFDPTRVVSGGYPQISAEEGAPLLNRATQGLYPPGSTFKVVTASALLESNLGFTPTSTFDDTGRYETPGGDISNFGGSVFGEHTLTTALTNSINTTFARIGDLLGADRLAGTMDAYGIGEPPPVDLPGGELQASGRHQDGELLPNGERGIDTARVAIGQERLLMTPVQMAMVAAGVANGGTVMAPRLVDRVVDRDGELVRRESPQEVGQPLGAESAAAMTEMMTNVVASGTGVAAALQGLSVAGKTGTAETGDAARNQAWFVGFAPADAPVVAVAVVIEDTSSTGGSVAAPVAGRVMEAAITARGG